ncbi:phosphotransferase [Labedaea rhizosphaerae]|uniref:Phosphotransferase family enzyme n=1 Tax=Labedaea rhizosphaerae TaxID=598644 RepID=A0A4R6S9J9_LABRH|nr:phosphotransferase [Labedaea rhizosphaerae]TDP96560.1 phosphotransferase family enzyme [Labedaea rhizosphaerae]
MIDEAVGAAVAVASSYGLRADPEVLKDGANTLVRLGPVVARVATETARARAGVRAWIERDIRVARHVASRGVRATRPAVDPPAGPHFHAGFTLAFWDFEPHSPDAPVDPVDFAVELAALHDAMTGLDLSDCRGPAGDLVAILPGLDLPDRLRAEASALASAVAQFPARPLHGDAHPGNVLVTGAGLVWNDFEDAWQGPLGWDLACLRLTGRLDGEAAVRAYPGAVDAEELEVCTRFRELYAAVWVAFRAQKSPEWQPEATRRLARWLD